MVARKTSSPRQEAGYTRGVAFLTISDGRREIFAYHAVDAAVF